MIVRDSGPGVGDDALGGLQDLQSRLLQLRWRILAFQGVLDQFHASLERLRETIANTRALADYYSERR